jgi:pseudaminic acid synthase
MEKVLIGNKLVGKGQPTYIIAEAGSNHDGKLKQAKELIDVAAAAGANAVKFQLFKAEEIAAQTKNEIVKLDNGKTLYNFYKSLEFARDWLGELNDYSKERGIEFMATPFDREAVDLLDKLNTTAFKISSFEIVDLPLIKYVACKHKPVILSTGMATLGEIEDALDIMYQENNEDAILLHCGIGYPLDYSEVNLLQMKTLSQAFQCPIGYSDHTMGISVPIAAVALGASVIEKHFTLDRNLNGPDHKFAVIPSELTQMIKSIRQVEQAKGSPIKKPTTSEAIHRKRGRRSMFAKVDILKGTRITQEMISILRPGIGLAPKYLEIVVGRVAQVDIAKNEPITWDSI